MTSVDTDQRFWLITAWDKPGLLETRLAHYDEHRAYLNAATIDIVMAGPTVADDGDTPTGSFFVVRAQSRDEAAAFNAGDPFNLNGVWGEIDIREFLLRRGKVQL